MTNIDKEKVLAHLHLMQKDIEQIKRIISGSEIKEPPQPPTNLHYHHKPIGTLVRRRLKNTLEQRQWSEQEFLDFFDESYSKTTFDINYPLLSLYRFDGKLCPVGYYEYPILVNDKRCYLCSQWYEGSRKMVLDFLKQYENL